MIDEINDNLRDDNQEEATISYRTFVRYKSKYMSSKAKENKWDDTEKETEEERKISEARQKVLIRFCLLVKKELRIQKTLLFERYGKSEELNEQRQKRARMIERKFTERDIWLRKAKVTQKIDHSWEIGWATVAINKFTYIVDNGDTRNITPEASGGDDAPPW